MSIVAGNSALVFRRASALMGQPWAGVDTETFDMLVSFFGHRLVSLWETAEWPEITHTELRLSAEAWVYGNSYPVGVTRYDAASRAVWEVVDPAGVNGTEAPGVSPKWMRVKRDYAAPAWDPATSYVYGDLVYWSGIDGTFAYIGASSVAGVLPSSTSHWRVRAKDLGDFPRVDVGQNAELGTVFRVSPDDPNSYDIERPEWLHRITPDGIRVQTDPGAAWFRYREAAPRIVGGIWDATANYLAGDQVYYEAGRVGHFYNAIAATTNSAPTSGSGAWDPVVWPNQFESALAFGIHADWLRLDGQHDKAERAEIQAALEVERLLEVLVKQQKQYARTRVLTR